MNDQTPPPTPDEEWAKKLGLNFDPEVAKDNPEPPAEQPPLPPGEPQSLPQIPQPPYGNPMPPQPPFPPQMPPVMPQMPPTYLVWSILALVFCCFPPAIVAIIYSAMVSSKFYAHDYEGAKRCSERAQIWIIVSIVLGVVTMALYLPLSLLG